MLTLPLTLAGKVVTTVPRVALHVAGTAWEVAGAIVDKAKDTVAGPERPAHDAVQPAPVPTLQVAQHPPTPTMPAPDVTVDEPAPSHDALPLEDYDHLTVGTLRGRVRSLALPELRQVHAYETAHGNRLPVVTVLANRIAALEKDQAPTRT